MANVPAYMRIMQYVLDLSIKHKDLDVRIMSERELSTQFHVARTTVRKALKSLLESELIYVKPGRGMFINQGRRPNLSMTTYRIGFVIGDGQYVDIDGMHLWIMEKICNALRSYPARLKTLNFSGRDLEMDEELALYNPDAILWFRPSKNVSGAIAKLRKRMHVEIIGHMPCGDPHATTMDYGKAGRLAAEWFLRRKLERVFLVGYDRKKDSKFGVINGFYQTWRETFSEAGIAYEKNFLIEIDSSLEEKTAERIKTSGVEGAFCFNYAYGRFLAGVRKSACGTFPIMVDEDFTYRSPELPEPTVKMELVSPLLAQLAVARTFKHILKKAETDSELVLEPRLMEG